jgi:hemolysin III
MAIHAAGLVGALIGGIILLTAVAPGGGGAMAASVAYVLGLLAMLACSTAYNWGRSGAWHEALQRLDQSAIFLMIAGSYTPFTALQLSGAWSAGLTASVWVVAATGMLLRFLAPLKFERV